MKHGSRAALLWCLLLLSSCRRGMDRNAEPRIEFGVLFGGDIQDRPVIPLELDASRQELALRVTFPEPVQRERRVRFELERPPAPNRDKGVAELGEIRAYPGERRAETKLAFRRGDAPGTWQLRVRVDEGAQWSRRFEVVPAR